MLARRKRRFPYRSFIDFTVAGNDEDTRFLAPHAQRERPPHADRQTMAESAGRGFDARDLDRFRMAAEDRIEPAKSVEDFEREETFVGEHDILREAAVPLAQNAAVALRPGRLGRAV